MKKTWTAFAPVVLLATAGCLASKSDIRLLQDELRATRAQLATGDTSILRANETSQQQLAALSSRLDRLNDSLRTLTERFATFQATANGQFDAMGQQMIRVQELLGQTTRNIQDTRQQLQALREQGGITPPAAGGATDSTGAAASGVPGPSTLFLTGKQQLDNGAFGTARSAFEQLLASYPSSDEAPHALLFIGETYKWEGNTAAADSVYQLVADRYPKTPEAASGLYRHGMVLWNANKRSEARIALNRLIRDYPNSDEAKLAKDLLNPRE